MHWSSTDDSIETASSYLAQHDNHRITRPEWTTGWGRYYVQKCGLYEYTMYNDYAPSWSRDGTGDGQLRLAAERRGAEGD